jgi:NADPH:quinone reductase-like Zn-dependent oxidoreductase
MAQQTVVPRGMHFPVPDGANDAAVAAIMNPALSSWTALKHRAELRSGETVLVLGGTGVAGRLAVQIARRLGAGRVLVAGRDEAALGTCGADGTLRVDATPCVDALRDALARENAAGLVVLDYLWGAPAEALLSALAPRVSGHSALVRGGPAGRVRYVEVGEMAGEHLSLRASLLRAVDVVLCGSGGGSLPVQRYREAVPEVLEAIARGELHLRVEEAPLSDVEAVWMRKVQGSRFVIRPGW